MILDKNPARLGIGTLMLAAALLLPSAAHSQTNCSGTLSGTYDDVLVTGGSCTLDGALVRGSVIVTDGSLTATGGTRINGSVLAGGSDTVTLTGGSQVDGGVLGDAAGDFDLQDVSVLGDVALLGSGDLTVGLGASLSSVKVEESGRLDVAGSVGSIESKASGRIDLDGAVVFPGSVVVSKGQGPLVLCGATIEGELKVSETDGSVVADAGCGPDGGSTIGGAISVEKGVGNVVLVGASVLAGDLLVVEQQGKVEVENSSLSDILVEKITGSVTLVGVVTDSDTAVNGNGNVTIDASAFGGDVRIEENDRVKVTSSSFSLEDILIAKNAGPVIVQNNTDFSIALLENDRVKFNGNTFSDANISKNTGFTRINDNTGEVLSCSDNSPAPTGSGNTITELADGQCAGF